MKIILTLLYVVFTTLGLSLFKLGGDTLVIGIKEGLNFKIGYLTLAGFLCYFISFLLWQKVLTMFDLSYIVPITTGIVQVIIILISYFVFKETITFQNLIGIVLVIIGVILISITKK